MIFEAVLFLWGIGVWDTGLQSMQPVLLGDTVAPIEKKWTFAPDINAKAVIVIDADSAQILYEKNAHEKLPMASLTKMMTALVMIESHDLSEVITISKASSHTDGSSMRLQNGEKISLENLLTGLLIKSGNDAAIALAEYHSKTVYSFVDEMNQRARKLRLKNTNFSNPHGFDSPYHYSSAYDMAILSKKILQHPLLKKVASLPFATVTSENGEVIHALKNTNELLGGIYPVYGIKTGTTPNALQCLSLFVETKNRRYIIVILGSEDRYLDAKVLLWRILL